MVAEWGMATIDDLKAPYAGSIAIGPFGSRMKSDCYVSEGVPVIRGNNIGNTRAFIGEFVHVTEEFASGLGNAIVRPDDLVFPHRGAIGQVGIVPRGSIERYALSSSLMKLTCDRSKAEPLFLFYYLRSALGQHELLKNASTVGTPGIGQPLASLKSIRVPLPSLPEQVAIAEVLAALDDKIELNRRMNATLEAMARALFQSWFVDFDPVRAKLDGRQPFGLDSASAALFPHQFEHASDLVIPKGWSLMRWGDIATLEYGKSLRQYRDRGGKYRVFGTNGPIGFHDECLSPVPGIIIGRKGAYRGVHYSPDPFFVIDTAFYLNPIRPLNLLWCYFELLRLNINSMDSGSAIPSTSRDDFYSLPVVVPTSAAQELFGRIVGGWFSKISANNEESRTLASIRNTLLPKLLSGEIRVEGQ